MESTTVDLDRGPQSSGIRSVELELVKPLQEDDHVVQRSGLHPALDPLRTGCDYDLASDTPRVRQQKNTTPISDRETAIRRGETTVPNQNIANSASNSPPPMKTMPT